MTKTTALYLTTVIATMDSMTILELRLQTAATTNTRGNRAVGLLLAYKTGGSLMQGINARLGIAEHWMIVAHRLHSTRVKELLTVNQ